VLRDFTVLSTLGLVCHGCGVFVLECNLLARLLASRLALCVVVFVFTPLLMQFCVHAV